MSDMKTPEKDRADETEEQRREREEKEKKDGNPLDLKNIPKWHVNVFSNGVATGPHNNVVVPVFGNNTVDLSGLKRGETVSLDIAFAMFATIIIVVPRICKIESQGTMIKGDVVDTRVESGELPEDAPVVQLRRFGAFCKIIIENEQSQEAKEACAKFNLSPTRNY